MFDAVRRMGAPASRIRVSEIHPARSRRLQHTMNFVKDFEEMREIQLESWLQAKIPLPGAAAGAILAEVLRSEARCVDVVADFRSLRRLGFAALRVQRWVFD